MARRNIPKEDDIYFAMSKFTSANHAMLMAIIHGYDPGRMKEALGHALVGIDVIKVILDGSRKRRR